MPSWSRHAAIAAALMAAARLAASDGDDTAIPPLAPQALESWWAGLAPHPPPGPLPPEALEPWGPARAPPLPHGSAPVSGGAMQGGGGDGPMVEGSAWAGAFRHPSATWSYGGAIGYSQRRWGLGPEFPAES